MTAMRGFRDLASGRSTLAASGAHPDQCTLLGGTFAILVQVALCIGVLTTLVYKRSKERPPRPWLVWFFDVSKQAYAGALQHGVNLLFGIFFARGGAASECAWYLVSHTITVVCGVMILTGAMSVYEYAVQRYDLKLLRSGEYGTPPSWRPWLAQMLLWGCLASGEKFVTALVVLLPLQSQLEALAEWIEIPLRRNPMCELVLVMVVAPIVMNACFFWILDNLVMQKKPDRQPLHDHAG